jgi:hypothetical protein
MGLCEWTIVNPELHGEYRNDAIEKVIDGIFSLAKELGVKRLCTFTNSNSLIQRFERRGMTKGDNHTFLRGEF